MRRHASIDAIVDGPHRGCDGAVIVDERNMESRQPVALDGGSSSHSKQRL